MLYLSKTALGLCPDMAIATPSGTPARTKLRTPVRRRSWKRRAGIPARFAADFHALKKLPIDSPSRTKTYSALGFRCLDFEHLKQLAGNRNAPRLVVLRCSSIEPDLGAKQIDIRPSQLENFCFTHPCIVTHREDRPEILGQLLPKLLIARVIEKALARRSFPQH